ncbi:HopJ type III effector protein [Halopseudomonas litoralis]|uniref:HopJ type III effector protein n=1 Tax=Halopseudomonas litoralis TaxID=797277 RepID=A0A1H1LGY2_9GAMM|nr:HopJ type III effector protein [Halopseudomonas litoralis]SDR73783.1 HopJ type III effector protein [Halopseudomonas litoralis]
MTAEQFKARLESADHRFAETLAFIEQHYHYQPSAFSNGDVRNSAEQNQGSCKLLAMALDQGLTDEQALKCFAEHYQSVLASPDGSDHTNIRSLMNQGLAGVSFDRQPLTRR